MLAQLEITYADGQSIRKRWDDRGQGPRWHRFELDHPAPVVEVIIDPDNKVLLDDGGPRRGLRVAPETDAAAHAAAHGQSWTQTAMQVLGL